MDTNQNRKQPSPRELEGDGDGVSLGGDLAARGGAVGGCDGDRQKLPCYQWADRFELVVHDPDAIALFREYLKEQNYPRYESLLDFWLAAKVRNSTLVLM